MKKFSFVIFTMVLLSCGCTSKTPEPVNVQATIAVAIQQTNDANPTETPTTVPSKTTPPTSTHAPTTTITLKCAEESLTYIQEVMPYLEDISDELEEFGALTKLLAEDGALVLDDLFKADLYFFLDQIYQNMSKMVEITPPSSMVTMHGYLEEAFSEFALARSFFKSGLDDFNLDDIESAATHLNSFSDYIVLATGEVTP